MSWLAVCGLDFLHFLRLAWTILLSLLYYPFLANPRPLHESRTKLPNNLALVLVTSRERPSDEEKDAIIRSVVSAARWCQVAGVNALCVYDRHGVAIKLSTRIKTALHYDIPYRLSSDGSDATYPASPPSPESIDSRFISFETRCSPTPIVVMKLELDLPHSRSTSYQRKNGILQIRKHSKRTSQMTLTLASYESSKPFIASIARSFATNDALTQQTRTNDGGRFAISVEKIDKMVQESLRLAPPDLIIVHSVRQYSLSCPPLELHGFPPWLMKLTEIYHDERPSLSSAWHNRSNKQNFAPISEENFRRALDSYSRAEQRLGK